MGQNKRVVAQPSGKREDRTRSSGKANLVDLEVLVPARGVLHVHSCPPALCPHVAWAVARELGVRVDLMWSAQPAAPGLLRSELEWRGRVGTAGRIATSLMGWAPLRFEVTELASPGCDGWRYSYTDRLGLFSAATGANGDIVVGEERLRALLRAGGDLALGLETLLGTSWDNELEPYRRGAEIAPMARMHQVV
jgi:hypothetical protein